MCGIVGVIGMEGELSSSMIDFFEKLVYHDTVRGPHSTGVMGLFMDKTVKYKKSARPGPDFLEWPGYEGFRKSVDKKKVRALIGHNRWATVGNVIDKNAHPFVHNKICLVHNGTLRDKDELGHEVEVDSEALTREVAIKGWEEALPAIDGSYALAWMDANNCTIHLTRNYERPLAWQRVREGGKDYIILASEKEMITWLVKRAKFIHTHHQSRDAEEIESMKMYSLAFGDELTSRMEVKEERYTKKFKTYQSFGYSGYGRTWQGFGMDDDLEDEVYNQNKYISQQENLRNSIRGYHTGVSVSNSSISPSRSLVVVGGSQSATTRQQESMKQTRVNLLYKKLICTPTGFTPYNKVTRGEVEMYLPSYQPYLTQSEYDEAKEYVIHLHNVDRKDYDEMYQTGSVFEAEVAGQYDRKVPGVSGTMYEHRIITLKGCMKHDDMKYVDEKDDVVDLTDPLFPTLAGRLDSIQCCTCKEFIEDVDLDDGDWDEDGTYVCTMCLLDTQDTYVN